MSLDRLILDPEARFSCASCGRCCSASWAILVPTDKRDEILARPWADVGRDPTSLFRPTSQGLWALAKQPGSTRCVLLGDDGLCELHRHWGADAKPKMCVRFPHLAVPSAEAVWVTANYGCKAVQEGHGASLESERADLAETFAPELAAVRLDADIGYPVGPELVLGGKELDDHLEALIAAMGDGLFAALATLAAATAAPGTAAPQPGGPGPATPLAAPASVRYAFALSLYSDAVDSSTFWKRLRAVSALPRMLRFTHRYTSRLLDAPVDMAAAFAHPGQLPPESEALVLTWLRSRLRGRLVLKDVPNLAAGLTRLLLQADAVLFFARALAAGRDITHADVLRGLEAVELYIANQLVVTQLASLDPRLPRLWQDPAVASGAAALFTPHGD